MLRQTCLIVVTKRAMTPRLLLYSAVTTAVAACAVVPAETLHLLLSLVSTVHSSLLAQPFTKQVKLYNDV